MTWESSDRARRFAGLCGLAGALLFCVGDMLFYGHFASGANFVVLQRKTYNPLWTVVANPAVLMVLSPLADRAPAPLSAMLVGGFTNLSIAIFFLVSLLTTWNRRQGA
jgi:hypothetical protein